MWNRGYKMKEKERTMMIIHYNEMFNINFEIFSSHYFSKRHTVNLKTLILYHMKHNWVVNINVS